MHSDFEKFDDAPKEDKHDEPPFVELAVSDEQLKYVHYMTKQVLEVNSKKFYHLVKWEIWVQAFCRHIHNTRG